MFKVLTYSTKRRVLKTTKLGADRCVKRKVVVAFRYFCCARQYLKSFTEQSSDAI